MNVDKNRQTTVFLTIDEIDLMDHGLRQLEFKAREGVTTMIEGLHEKLYDASIDLQTPPTNKAVSVRYDLSPAEHESAIRNHLISMGWTPPEGETE